MNSIDHGMAEHPRIRSVDELNLSTTAHFANNRVDLRRRSLHMAVILQDLNHSHHRYAHFRRIFNLH